MDLALGMRRMGISLGQVRAVVVSGAGSWCFLNRSRCFEVAFSIGLVINLQSLYCVTLLPATSSTLDLFHELYVE